MGATSKVETLLAERGFDLVRQKKHRVFRRDDGKTVVLSSTPSDCRWEQNAMTVLARVLGIRRRELTHGPEISRPRIAATVIEAEPPMVVPAAENIEVENIEAPEPRVRLTRRERQERQRANESRNQEIARQAKVLRRRRELEEKQFDRELKAELEAETAADIVRRHPNEEKFVSLMMLRLIVSDSLEDRSIDKNFTSFNFARYIERELLPFIPVFINIESERQEASLIVTYVVSWDKRRHLLVETRSGDDASFSWDCRWMASTSTEKISVSPEFTEWMSFVFGGWRTLENVTFEVNTPEDRLLEKFILTKVNEASVTHPGVPVLVKAPDGSVLYGLDAIEDVATQNNSGQFLVLTLTDDEMGTKADAAAVGRA